MIPVGGYPILWHIMKSYAQWGHKEFVLCLGYKGEVIKNFFLDYESLTRDFTITLGHQHTIEYCSDPIDMNWRVTLADTGLQAMTGARIKRIRKYVANEDHFMLTYGDAVGSINFDKLIEFHMCHNRVLTITGVRPPGRFGEMVSDAGGRVIEFNEKPQVSGGRISGGFFVCRKEIFDYLDDRENLVFEVEPMNRMVADQQVMTYEHDDFWHPMDTSRDYQLLNGLCEQGKAPWIVW
jgi:glucose-1-phosphate cytidylyltransferase